jgi:hypothetical protein
MTIQETPLEPEKPLSPTQDARNEVSINICSFYFHLINHPQFGNSYFSEPGCITIKLSVYCE